MVKQPTIPPSSLSPCAPAMAAPPVSREVYFAEMTQLREHVLKVKGAGSVEQAIQSGIPVQETTTKLAERLITSIAAIEDRVATLEGTTIQAIATFERTVAQATPIERRRKPLAESKCIGNMKTLGSDKAEFRVWNDKFINATAQTQESRGEYTCAT